MRVAPVRRCAQEWQRARGPAPRGAGGSLRLSALRAVGRLEYAGKTAMRILVAEDEPAIADFVERGLSAEGYAVTVAHDGDAALRAALAEDFALVILDRMMPGCDGLDVLARLRPVKPELPVIMLTAKTAVDERVEGLDAGAVDYVTKPFAFDELAARVRAHLRTPAQPSSTQLVALDIEMDLLTRHVRRDGVDVPLSAKEFELLAY